MALDLLVAIVVIVPIASALLAILTFIIGMVVVSLRGGVEALHVEARHRADAREAHEKQVVPCINDEREGSDLRDGEGCRPSQNAYFPPQNG